MRGERGFPVRIRFTKRGKVRFISHRDVARAFERAFRVASLPLAFTQGFSPRPRVSFGLALSVGHESDAEYLDVELAEPVDLDAVSDGVGGTLPGGMSVTGTVALADRAPALQEAVTSVVYTVEVGASGERPVSPPTVVERVAEAMAGSTLLAVRTRKGREVTEDVRPAIRRIEVRDRAEPPAPASDSALLELEVSTQPRGVRPGEVVAALGAGLVERHVLRTHQWIERGGARLEPLEADPRLSAFVADTRAAEARAS